MDDAHGTICPTCGEGYEIPTKILDDVRTVKAAWRRLVEEGVWLKYEGAGWKAHLGGDHVLHGTPAQWRVEKTLRELEY